MIHFKKLRYMNILSTGNLFTEINLCKSKSTLIVGENGAGKSTMIDALTFVLYGRGFRNINKPQLLNSITNKNLLVEVEFSVGNKDYMLRRGIKPSIFEIWSNGTLLNQNAGARDYQEFLEKNILKLNFKSFGQIVVLGSANYTPFMQLPAMQRRAVVEDLLDIQIFSVMNSLLKDKQMENKQALQDVDYHIDMAQQKIEMHQKHMDSLRQNNDELIAQKIEKIQEHQTSIDSLSIELDSLQEQINALNEQIADQEKITARKTKLVQMEATLEDRIRKLKKEITFFHDHDSCPTCKQGLTHDFKNEKISDREAKHNEILDAMSKLETEIDNASNRLVEITAINKSITVLNTKVTENNQQIKFCTRYVAELDKEIESLKLQGVKIQTNTDETQKYETELAAFNKQKENLSKEKAMHDVAAMLLRDTGIKTKIIRQYVPVMNKLIAKYLAALDFFVDFTLDESFNETIRSRYRDEFTYASFSEGEKLRIDLALMFTWRAIAKLRNSASTNLLIMDEVFDSSLDAAGIEEFIKILESLTDNTNTYIISHKGDQLFDRFENILRFEKHANFSRIAA